MLTYLNSKCTNILYTVINHYISTKKPECIYCISKYLLNVSYYREVSRQNLGENDKNTLIYENTPTDVFLSVSIMLSLEGNTLLSNNVKVKSTWLNG